MTPDDVAKARRLQREVNERLDRVEHAVADPTITSAGFDALIAEARRAEDEFFAHLRACRP